MNTEDLRQEITALHATEDNLRATIADLRTEIAALHVTEMRLLAAVSTSMRSGTKLWLWKNGDHFLAFRELHPCFSPGGDPMALGEPDAWAEFRESDSRAPSTTRRA